MEYVKIKPALRIKEVRMKKQSVVMVVSLLGIVLGILGSGAGCCCPRIVSPPPPPLPVCPYQTTTIAFERVVWALPVGVEIRYPAGVANNCPVIILASRPERWISSWISCITTGRIHTCTDKVYIAIPVADPSNIIGVKWYLVLLEDHLVELERMDVPLKYIEVFPIIL